MSLSKPWRVALAAMLLCPVLAFAQSQEVRDRPLRIVVLQGTDVAQTSSALLDRVIRETIQKDISGPITYFTEAIDTLRVPSRNVEPEFLALLQAKYRDFPVDLVIVFTEFALNFATRHRDALWPGTPVVFHGIAEERLQGRTFPSGFYGTPVKYDIEGTFKVARELQPDARHVLVIGGSADFDARWSIVAEEIARRVFPALPVERINHLPIDALSSKLQTLQHDSIVLFTTMYRDTAGGSFIPRDAVARLSAASNAPVYAFFGTYVGVGIAGGSVESFEMRGQRAGALAIDILLKRFPAAPLATAPVPSSCVLDYPALARWHLDGTTIPQGCTVLNRKPTLLEQYLWPVVGMLALIVGQGLLIGYLLAQRRARRSAEGEVRSGRTELAHSLRLASVGKLTASLTHEINQPLGAILSNTDAAELLLEGPAPPMAEIRQILADIRRDDLRANQVILRVRSLLEKNEMKRVAVDVNAAIEEVIAIVRGEAQRRRVEIVSQVAPGRPSVSGDSVHLQQVVLNLILNAMDAMAETPIAQRKVVVCSALRSNDSVEIAVSDHGSGISPERLDRLFDSFFTTKPHGLGLGLSISRTIIEAHGGRIWAQSAEGRGAVLRFTLPLQGVDDKRASPGIEHGSVARST